jgi:hypothetical protein
MRLARRFLHQRGEPLMHGGALIDVTWMWGVNADFPP